MLAFVDAHNMMLIYLNKPDSRMALVSIILIRTSSLPTINTFFLALVIPVYKSSRVNNGLSILSGKITTTESYSLPDFYVQLWQTFGY